MLDIFSTLHDPDNNPYLDSLPASIYWKNKEGCYLGRNLFAAKKMCETGLLNPNTNSIIIGKTDFDLFPREAAELYRRNDLQVMRNKREIINYEQITLPNGNTLTQISTKKPLLNLKNRVIGIIGITFDVSAMNHFETLKKTVLDDTEKKHNTKILSKRQFQCLSFLVKGKTQKQMGQLLNLSPRTIEHCIESLKYKLVCHSSAELIVKAVQLKLVELK